jgi:hypothetical protein
MKGISNISAAWSEVPIIYDWHQVYGLTWPHSGLAGAWHYPCVSNRECDRDTKEIRLDDAEVGDMNELLESHGEELSNIIQFSVCKLHKIKYFQAFRLITECNGMEPNVFTYVPFNLCCKNASMNLVIPALTLTEICPLGAQSHRTNMVILCFNNYKDADKLLSYKLSPQIVLLFHSLHAAIFSFYIPWLQPGVRCLCSCCYMTWIVQWIRLALSKVPNRVSICLSSPEDGNRSSSHNAVFSGI